MAAFVAHVVCSALQTYQHSHTHKHPQQWIHFDMKHIKTPTIRIFSLASYQFSIIVQTQHFRCLCEIAVRVECVYTLKVHWNWKLCWYTVRQFEIQMPFLFNKIHSDFGFDAQQKPHFEYNSFVYRIASHAFVRIYLKWIGIGICIA